MDRKEALSGILGQQSTAHTVPKILSSFMMPPFIGHGRHGEMQFVASAAYLM